MKITLEAAIAQQERKRRLEREQRRLERERHANAPSAKVKRDRHKAKADENRRLFTAYMDAELAEAKETPLYEVVLEHIDIADPKFASLRARIMVSVKLTIAACEYGLGSWRIGPDERDRRLAKAKEILAVLQGNPLTEAADDTAKRAP